MISLSQLESIAQKFNSLERPNDFLTVDIGLTQEEHYLLNLFRIVMNAALFNELKVIHDKIRNHHHVTLSVEDSRDFRKNGNRVGEVVYYDDKM